LLPTYQSLHGEVHVQKVMDFMVKDESNPSSIMSCLSAARENARAVRGTLTTEVWETHNQTWLEVRRMVKNGDFERDPGQFFEWVKFRSHLSRGVTVGTMLMDEALHFMRLGTFLERADNTARLVDVKFHALQSDFFGTASEKERVAELLILRPDMPRSLHSSLNEVVSNLGLVSTDQSGETHRRAGKLRAELKYGRIDEILATGLHAYLTQFLDRVNDLGLHISREFLVPSAA
ncbi:MAG: alpha-E domain-containing protein, partial [Betaproteobacteria bacterium]|nr:alpha-E domain-containing protein [Betaproteobacteria bacterium]